MTNQQIFEFGMRIDKACDNQDVDKLKLIITEIENYILSLTVEQKEIEQKIINLRKAKQDEEFSKVSTLLLAGLLYFLFISSMAQFANPFL